MYQASNHPKKTAKDHGLHGVFLHFFSLLFDHFFHLGLILRLVEVVVVILILGLVFVIHFLLIKFILNPTIFLLLRQFLYLT